jgi:hypothetical protein
MSLAARRSLARKRFRRAVRLISYGITQAEAARRVGWTARHLRRQLTNWRRDAGLDAA